MFYLPRYKEQFESLLPKEEILRRLEIAVKHSKKSSYVYAKLEAEEQQAYLFNGLVSAAGFSISLMLDRPENFFPLINGKIYPLASGTMISIEYSLFKSIKLFYIFFIALLSAIAIYQIYAHRAWGIVVFTLAVQLLIFFIMQAKFRTGVKQSRKELRRLLL